MAGEIVYADLRRPGGGFSPAEKCHAPALCPPWHGVLLKASGLGHLVLLVVVVVLSVQVFQGFLHPAMPSAPHQGSELQGRNHTEQSMISALMQYLCKSQCESPAACPGCELCPQDWQLHGDRCYRLSKEKGNWTQGKKDCKNQEAQLMTFQDTEGKEYIKKNTGGGMERVWIEHTSSEKKQSLHSPGETGEMCWTLKDEALEDETCTGEYNWVCQKTPFKLFLPTAGDGKKCGPSV
ncbi:killer cell lectin-like receptor subfamily B member 1B allele C [Egretta garzetta]|uniref:killer cell lectin-like receptor subfamily B member 1B allele C n=1 Tax=Egretta garzetta TaxID=188379 RepID=UPI00163D2E63|nr:killer cell lectin-like receptor subfamily B member 1B allele C [Egretta garzetta]